MWESVRKRWRVGICGVEQEGHFRPKGNGILQCKTPEIAPQRYGRMGYSLLTYTAFFRFSIFIFQKKALNLLRLCLDQRFDKEKKL